MTCSLPHTAAASGSTWCGSSCKQREMASPGPLGPWLRSTEDRPPSPSVLMMGPPDYRGTAHEEARPSWPGCSSKRRHVLPFGSQSQVKTGSHQLPPLPPCLLGPCWAKKHPETHKLTGLGVPTAGKRQKEGSGQGPLLTEGSPLCPCFSRTAAKVLRGRRGWLLGLAGGCNPRHLGSGDSALLLWSALQRACAFCILLPDTDCACFSETDI